MPLFTFFTTLFSVVGFRSQILNYRICKIFIPCFPADHFI